MASDAAARNKIRECDTKLSRYRAALDSGADPTVVGTWIAQTQAERAAADARLRRGSGDRMTRDEITRLVTALGDLRAVLREADPDDKAEVYRQLGLRLTYQPETQTVRAEADLDPHRGVNRVRGATLTLRTWSWPDKSCSFADQSVNAGCGGGGRAAEPAD